MNAQEHMDHCPFCALDRQRILWSEGRLRIVLPRGPLVPGHLLIVACGHTRSFRGADREMRDQLFAQRAILGEAISLVYGEPALFFEHGVGAEHAHDAEIHCGHAHQNLIPSSFTARGLAEVVEKLEAAGLVPVQMDESAVRDWYATAGGQDYYYIGDRTTHYRLGYDGVVPGHRFFRRHLGALLGLSGSEAAAWEGAGCTPLHDRSHSQLQLILRSGNADSS